jgi:hypothetical protein
VVSACGAQTYTANSRQYLTQDTTGSLCAITIGTVAQGAPAVVGNAWPVTLAIGGGLNAVGNPIFVSPGTGASFTVTAAALTNASQKTQIVDGSGNVIASTSNNLNVQCANCSGSGVSTADGAAFTAGASLFAGGGGFFQTTATSNPLTTGQQGTFQVTAQRALFTNLRNASGTEVGTAAAPLQVSVANTAANGTAMLVTGTGGTFPISGSLTANQSVNTAQVNGVTTLTGTGAVGTGAQRIAVGTDTATIAGSAPGSAGTASPNVLTVQGVASMTKLLVTPDSVALPANQSVNLAQVAGATTATGHGTASGALRVELPTDGTGLVTVAQPTAANLNATVVGTGTLATQAAPTSSASGGATSFHIIAAASDNHQNVTTAASTVYSVEVTSSSTSTTVSDYVRLYDAGAGFNGCNSATNIKWGMAVPTGASNAVGGYDVHFPTGKAFASGIALCVTGGGATPSDTDVSNAHTTTVVNIEYK